MEGSEVPLREIVGDMAGRVGWGQNLEPLKNQISDFILRH